MKRITALLLALLLASAALAGCSSSHRSGVRPTEEATAAETQEMTDAPTEALTTAPTEAQTQAPTPTQAPETGFIYTNPKYGWTVEVPNVWNDYGIILEENSGNSIRFMYEKAYEEDGAGHLFTIVTTTEPINTDQLPSGGELYRADGHQVYWWKATDVQYGVYLDYSSDEFKQQSKEYGALYDTMDGILDSFVW